MGIPGTYAYNAKRVSAQFPKTAKWGIQYTTLVTFFTECPGFLVCHLRSPWVKCTGFPSIQQKCTGFPTGIRTHCIYLRRHMEHTYAYILRTVYDRPTMQWYTVYSCISRIVMALSHHLLVHCSGFMPLDSRLPMITMQL